MKFKVGDKVKFTYGGLVGQGAIRIVDNSFFPYLVVSENGMCLWLKENELELINPDLRDLLQVGYKVDLKYDNGLIAKGYDVNDSMLYALKRGFDCYLNNNKLGDKITAIYKPKHNGVKPMEWVLVWEREKEKLYTLELPNNNHKHKYYRHHFNGNYNFNKGLINDASVKCMFTQEEIDNLPNQELIKSLVKKEIKGN
ncbi:DUF1642 domain-containing protein [Erysipelothrix sp. HDW6A]|uniref:DUF1642 domain-containing protein n=1 Tax=Erysipelothrix sp. HDW6A TaxID=2714928 RepID=UPI00140B20BD|nr:DUF1642 domain-containing protein [Erysipelothrix sp. HDW6A]QIK56636.1 DUF1642 domain-containing protein [Erysipelothrix sp. HDW6A]